MYRETVVIWSMEKLQSLFREEFWIKHRNLPRYGFNTHHLIFKHNPWAKLQLELLVLKCYMGKKSERSWYFCDNAALGTWLFFPFLFLVCSITSKICNVSLALPVLKCCLRIVGIFWQEKHIFHMKFYNYQDKFLKYFLSQRNADQALLCKLTLVVKQWAQAARKQSEEATSP